jgi:signal transduction histidine kinase
MTSAIVLLALLVVLRARLGVVSRPVAAAIAVAVALVGPFLLRDLARGIVAPPRGGSTSLWLAWHVALFLASTIVLLLGAPAGRVALGRRRGLPTLLAPAIAAAAALAAHPLLGADGRWPPWYPALWIVAIAALAFTRRTRLLVLAAAAVASLGAMTLVWGSTVRWRQALAESDVAGLTRVDPVIATLLDRLALDLADDTPPRTRAELLAAYAASDLAAADHAVQLTAWSPAGARAAEVTDVGGEGLAELRALADSARASGAVLRQPIATRRGVRVAVAVPAPDGWVTTAAVAQRTRLLPEDPYAPLFVGAPAPGAQPPYAVSLAEGDGAARTAADGRVRWTRRGDALHGDWGGRIAAAPTTVHVEIELRSQWALLQRGALLLLLDLLVVGTFWLLNALAERGLPRWLRVQRRQWSRSYRARLSLALFGFFVVPAAAFGVWISRQLQSDYRQSRELLVSEALRTVAARAATDSAAPDSVTRPAPGDAPLLVYRGNVLTSASDELLATLAPLGRLLPPEVALDVARAGHVAASHVTDVGDARVLVGYRAVAAAAGPDVVLAVPARADDIGLDARRRDLGVLVLLATALGALAALWLSGIAARQLARPIGALREAALSIAAGGGEPPLRGPEPPAEFVPVFAAFRRMAADLAAGRVALEEANRRTAAVLRNVASAVVAVDASGAVTLFNPAAERLFGDVLATGSPLGALGVPALEAQVRSLCEQGPAVSDDDIGLELGGRQVLGRVTPLRAGGGAVITLDDVTELARAQRVLAWGEMARQVAHEIKNPLTPIRLGVQHLKRARSDARPDFDRILDQNVGRILAEIDRLDEIARAFSRYGTAPAERAAGEPTDVAAIARDVVELERLGEGAVRWELRGADEPAVARARGEELREVLLNLLENARLADARTVSMEVVRAEGRVRVVVSDDGAGIAADVLPRVFEPHFSTRTSGSGLGLAISRRMVEGWGGAIGLASEPGRGTRVEVALVAADGAAPPEPAPAA